MSSSIRRAKNWSRLHPQGADSLVTGALLIVALVSSRAAIDFAEVVGPPGLGLPTLPEEVLGLVLTLGPLAFRRRAPITTVLACAAGFVGSRLLLDAQEASVVGVGISVAVYSAAAYGRPPWRNWACGVAGVAVVAELWRELATLVPDDQPRMFVVEAFALLFYAVLIAAMWALGSAMGAGRRRTAELVLRTAQLEQQREENARRAVFDERVRIARELHDVVAHHVSVMGVQAGAARLVMTHDPDGAADALTSIEASSRQAVDELHRLLGFLRQAGDPDGLAPRPGIAQLGELASSVSDSDLRVRVAVEGDARPLPPTVDVSAYRIVQEALTNTLKHARASHADVRVRYTPGEVEVRVVDDGRGSAPEPLRPGGLGLVGMRERAALHGGSVSVGPLDGGGFAVLARLPTPEGAL